MNAVLEGRIVGGRARNTFNMPTFRVHPTDYPEIEAEGRTPDEACDRLVLLLVQAMDLVIETWKCQPLGLAIARSRDRWLRRGTRASGRELTGWTARAVDGRSGGS